MDKKNSTTKRGIMGKVLAGLALFGAFGEINAETRANINRSNFGYSKTRGESAHAEGRKYANVQKRRKANRVGRAQRRVNRLKIAHR